MKFRQLTKAQQDEARQLTDRAWKAGIPEATVSQVAQDLTGWRRRIQAAEQA